MRPWATVLVVFVVLGAAAAGLGLWAVQMQRAAAVMARDAARAAAAQSARAEAEAARAEAEGSREQGERAAPKDDTARGFAPAAGGTGADEFNVTSITIDGLEKAGLSTEDIAGIEVEMDDGAPGLGRPSARKVPIGQLVKPVSPLRLHRAEINRIANAIVGRINEAGFIGVYVGPSDPWSENALPPDGAVRFTVLLGIIDAVTVEDSRAGADPADAQAVREACPLKVGDHINKKKLDAFLAEEQRKLGTKIDAAFAPGEKIERVALFISIGGAKK